MAAADNENGFALDFGSAKKFISEIKKPGFEYAGDTSETIRGTICSRFVALTHVVYAVSLFEKRIWSGSELEGQHSCQP